jgi:hypothetical protein
MRAVFSSTVVVLVFVAAAARAEVTAQEVWASWQDMMTSGGQEMTVGTVTEADGLVEVVDVVVAYNDQLGGSTSVSFDKLSFKDNDDGTVTITMPDSYPFQMAFPPEQAPPGSIKLTISQPGMQLIAGGSATETSYTISAPTMTITLDEVTDETGRVQTTEGGLALTAVEGGYRVTRTGDVVGLDSSFAAKSAVMTLSGASDISAGDTSGSGSIRITFDDLSGATKGNFLGAEKMANMALALNSGFMLDTSYSFGAMGLTAELIEPSGTTSFDADAARGAFNLDISKDSLRYGTELNGARFTISGGDIPFPKIEMAFTESALRLEMPVTKSDQPQDFGFVSKLVDLTVSDDIWNLFDPAATLARGPASLVIDLKGTGFWTKDIMDPEVQDAAGAVPGQIKSLEVTQFLAKGAGMEAEATGTLAFDNNDLVTFEGMSRPDGKVRMTVKGMYQLLDKLEALGFVSADEVSGMRLGLMMVAKPAGGPDDLLSEYEFRDGQVFANGMRLR